MHELSKEFRFDAAHTLERVIEHEKKGFSFSAQFCWKLKSIMRGDRS
tara:strand:- start:1037 stop:1177 length:141 start_codon:yes stop_codon:yes gene_type:complete